jgi:imidazolonepropionase-like amidohydrolase
VIRFIAVFAAFSLAAFPAPRKKALRGNLAIRDVGVVDVATGRVRKATVLIQGKTIAAVGNIRIPARTQIVDGRGKYVIPGLWDMHVHLWEKQHVLPHYVANGVTGIRDMGSDFQRTEKWRGDVEAGVIVGPRIVTSGSAVDGPASSPAKLPVIQAATPQEARDAADKLYMQGVDFLNVMSTLSEDAYLALAQRARLRRISFAGHVPDAVSVWDAVNARQKSMEHLFGVALACSSQESVLRMYRKEAILKGDNGELDRIRIRAYETFSPPLAMELFRRMARYGVFQTPTLIQLRLKQEYQRQAQIVELMARAGVDLLAGTDTGDPHVLPGSALHEELRLLVEAGLTPAEALRTATINPARFFGIDATNGTVDKGRRADLVLLHANPLEDIQNTQRISAVVLKGKFFDRKQLDRLMAEVPR